MFTKSLLRANPLKRNFATLVLAEHFEGKLNSNLGSLLTAASNLNDPDVDVLVHGADCQSQIDSVNQYAGVRSVLVAKDPSLQQSYGAGVAKVVKQVIQDKGYTNVVAGSTSFGKDVMPRVGGMMDMQAITDVIEICGDGKFKRPVYAGNAIATVSSSDSVKLVTVRSTNFAK